MHVEVTVMAWNFEIEYVTLVCEYPSSTTTLNLISNKSLSDRYYTKHLSINPIRPGGVKVPAH